MRINQDPMVYLANRKGIRGETLRVFISLTGMVDYQNKLPTQRKVAEMMGIKPAHISRACRQLQEIGFVLKKEGNWYISPLVCWKGTYKQLQNACRELSGEYKRHPGLNEAEYLLKGV